MWFWEAILAQIITSCSVILVLQISRHLPPICWDIRLYELYDSALKLEERWLEGSPSRLCANDWLFNVLATDLGETEYRATRLRWFRVAVILTIIQPSQETHDSYIWKKLLFHFDDHMKPRIFEVACYAWKMYHLKYCAERWDGSWRCIHSEIYLHNCNCCFGNSYCCCRSSDWFQIGRQSSYLEMSLWKMNSVDSWVHCGNMNWE